jgi:hypothetical protein
MKSVNFHYGVLEYDLCERYYAILLKEIKQYEISNTTNFNKGMVYANLGVCQVAQGKIDEGFANILKAHIEDEPYHRQSQRGQSSTSNFIRNLRTTR